LKRRRLQPLSQLRPSPPSRHVLHGNGDRLLLADQYHQPLATGNAGVQQVSLQHGVVLGQDGDDDGGVLGALALVNGRGVGGNQGVELAESVGDGAAVETGVSTPE